MNKMQLDSAKLMQPITVAGLFLALFGVPLSIMMYSTMAPEGPLQDNWVLMKELTVFGLTGILLLLVVKGEKLKLDSIGLHWRHWGKSIGQALLLTIGVLIILGLVLWVFNLVGITFGSGGEADRYKDVSPWVILLMVVRAGIVEEICYRGYVIERLRTFSGNWLVYFLMPVLLFGVWHYRQGIGGIIIATIAGAILALVYLKKRDLKLNIIAHFLVDFIPNIVVPLFVEN